MIIKTKCPTCGDALVLKLGSYIGSTIETMTLDEILVLDTYTEPEFIEVIYPETRQFLNKGAPYSGLYEHLIGNTKVSPAYIKDVFNLLVEKHNAASRLIFNDL